MVASAELTYRKDLYYVNTKVNGLSYRRCERVVSKWKFRFYKWLMPFRWEVYKGFNVLYEK